MSTDQAAPDRCPECARQVRVRKDGGVPKHHENPARAANGWRLERCDGAGMFPVTERDAAAPCTAPGCRAPGTHNGLHDIPAGKRASR